MLDRCVRQHTMPKIEDEAPTAHLQKGFHNSFLHGPPAGEKQRRVKIALHDRLASKIRQPADRRSGVDTHAIDPRLSGIQFIAGETACPWKSNDLRLWAALADNVDHSSGGLDNPSQI